MRAVQLYPVLPDGFYTVIFVFTGSTGISVRLSVGDQVSQPASSGELRLNFQSSGDPIVLSTMEDRSLGEIVGHSLTIVEIPSKSAPYTGGPFTGATENTDFESYSWAGEPGSSASIKQVSQNIDVYNIGTSRVSGLFTITGPAGSGSRIYNSTTDQTLTLSQPLRGKGLVADVYQAEAKDGMATVYTTKYHNLRSGDEIVLLNMAIPFSETTKSRIISQVSDLSPFSVSFPIDSDDVDLIPTDGQIYLVNNDTLEIDTYTKSVTYNGEITGHRHRLEILTDWVHFGPGNNVVEFYDTVVKSPVVSKQLRNNTVTLKTDEAHFFVPGEKIQVALPEKAELSSKELKNNKVTLVTREPHGFSAGDVVEVNSTETSTVITKLRNNGTTTLTTQEPNGVSPGDRIDVHLVESAEISSKELQDNVVTLRTPVPHGFSSGDRVQVSLPVSATVTAKSLKKNQVTLTTSDSHGYVVGDVINVVMPAGAPVVGKARQGSQGVITTASPHGYSVGDSVVVALPTTLTISGQRSISPTTGAVTLNTNRNHNFSVGDRISVNLGISSSYSVVFGNSSETTCTVTLDDNHKFSVGEKIEIAGTNSRFDGVFYISSTTPTTITYQNPGAVTVAPNLSGTITNLTTRDYYNGTKVVESVPTSSSFTYMAYNQEVSTSSALLGTAPIVDNATNKLFNGTKTVLSANSTQFSYNL